MNSPQPSSPHTSTSALHSADAASGGAAGSLWLGCAGWALSSNVADHFPSQGSHLERYAQVFSAVEINSSFYRPHRLATYARWHDSVPDSFRFSVKIPRTISHDQRLRDVGHALDTFLEPVNALRSKLGCLLIQLPPSLAFDEPIADEFFASLRQRTATPVACEPRHASWFTDQAANCLNRHHVACVKADPPPLSDVIPRGSRAFDYIRLHGAPRIYYSAYDETFLAQVAEQIVKARDAGRTVWCVFDNTAQGEAVPNALWLKNRLAAGQGLNHTAHHVQPVTE